MLSNEYMRNAHLRVYTSAAHSVSRRKALRGSRSFILYDTICYSAAERPPRRRPATRGGRPGRLRRGSAGRARRDEANAGEESDDSS